MKTNSGEQSGAEPSPQLHGASQPEYAPDAAAARQLLKEADSFLAQSLTPQAVPLLEDAIKLVPHEDIKLRQEVVGSLIQAYGRTSRFARVIELCRAELPQAQEAGDEVRQTTLHKALGNCFTFLGQTSDALQHYREAWKIVIRLDKPQEEAAILNNLGVLYRTTGETQEAIRCYTRALDIRQRIGDTTGLLSSQGNLADCYFATGFPEEAEKIYLKLIDSQDPHVRGLSLGGLGEVNLQRKNFAEARRLLEASLATLELTGETEVIGEMSLNYADVLLEEDFRDPEIAAILQKYGDRETGLKKPRQRARALTMLAEWFYRNGRFEEAYDSLSEARLVENQIHKEETETRIHALKSIHETDLARHEADTEREKSASLDAALAEAKRQRERAEQASEFKSEMLRMAAHDLRNPIGAVSSLLELALEPETSPSELQDFLQNAHSQTCETLRILDQLLDSAMIESGQIQISCKPCVFDTLVARLVEAERPAAKRKGQMIETVYDCGEAMVLTDASRFDQILRNLISNAIKYSPPGSLIQIVTRLTSTGLSCLVRDHGPGIAAEDLPRLFQRFLRLKTSRPTAGERSTGLGLYLCRLLADRLGATVSAHSEGLGHGSTFALCLPVAPNASFS